jgi:poly(beta-D-mannuronate) lyase
MRFWLLLTLLPLLGMAREIQVLDPARLESVGREAAPGDVLILPEGEFMDVSLLFEGRGTEKAPITLRAMVPGKTVFTGGSTLRISGQHLVVEGLHFKEPDPTISDLVMFRRDSKTPASHCRLTQCAITSSLKEDGKKESRWVGIYGGGNRVDHCVISGKTGKGTTLVVWLGEGSDGGHQIDHNYFGPREKLGKNGGETIRVGDSKTSMLKGGCLVEANLFEHCNGETECISNKSCGNLYRGNTFLEVGGTLTLRHGNGCTVEDNAFIGNGVNGTGGVRIIGEDHVVRGNYFENLAGDDARSSICLMMGIPDSPLNRYFQVKRARVTGNSLVNCEHPLLIGLGDDDKAVLAPVETVFEGNQIESPRHPVIEARCDLSGITWKDNQLACQETGIAATSGIRVGEAKVRKLTPLSRKDVGTSW